MSSSALPSPDRAFLKAVDARQQMLLLPPEPTSGLEFYPALFCNIGLPTEKQDKPYYNHTTGDYYLEVRSSIEFGVPYGSFPRGILNYIVTEIIRKQAEQSGDPRIIHLGDTFTEFLTQISGAKSCSGGSEGNLTRLREQFRALLTSAFYYRMPTGQASLIDGLFILMDHHEQRELFKPRLVKRGQKGGKLPRQFVSTIQISEGFFEDTIAHSVPIRPEVMRHLWGSCLRMDMYTWLTYRANKLNGKPLHLSWEAMAQQLGNRYAPENLHTFKRLFREAFQCVRQVYHPYDLDCVKITETGNRLTIVAKRPSALPLPLMKLREALKDPNSRASRRAPDNQRQPEFIFDPYKSLSIK